MRVTPSSRTKLLHLRGAVPAARTRARRGCPGSAGGPGEGADRRRTTVEAGPSELVGLDQRDLSIERSRLQGRVQAPEPLGSSGGGW